MRDFKDQLERDLADVFHNSSEFAEVLSFQIDGREYKGAIVVCTDKVTNRNIPDTDHVLSLNSSKITLYIPLRLLDKIPRKGCEVIFNEKFYEIAEVEEQMGEVVLSLEVAMEW